MDDVSFGTPVEENGSTPEISDETEFSLANPFLNGMPEEHKSLLSPYVKKWDGQVTKKFQDYSNRLKPYEALGPADELQKYYNFAQNFRQDPENLFKLMWRGLQEQYGEEFKTELLRILEIEAEEATMSQGSDQEYEQEETGYDPNEVFQQNVMQELEALREWKTNLEQSQEEAVGQAQLDNVLDQMHNHIGEFDDDFMIAQLAKHGDVQQAIQAWNNMIGKYSSQQTSARQAPKIMGGQGGVPTGQVDTEKLRGAQRREAVSNMLSQLE